jgi:hypothetical protein
VVTYSHAPPIDTNYIKAHALLFEKISLHDFEQVETEFTNILDSHIKGAYIAITNIASWFNYGADANAFRQVFLTELVEKAKTSPPAEEQLRTASPADLQDPPPPSVPKQALHYTVNALWFDPHFSAAQRLTYKSFALVLGRIGDKNVLPHVHIMLTFLATLAASPYVAQLLANAPWPKLVDFLNNLVKTESQIQNQSWTQNVPQPQYIDKLFATPIFPIRDERSDELPLPEDYLIRGSIWVHDHFPKTWFKKVHDEEERYLELASTAKSRTERVLRLGYELCLVRSTSCASRTDILTFV